MSWASKVRRALLGSSPRSGALAMLLVAFLLVTLIWPLVNVVTTGFVTSDGRLTTDYLALVLTDPVLRAGLLNSLLIALGTTLVALLLALPLAVLDSRYEFVGRSLLSSLLLVPMVLPPFVGALGTRLLLGRFGPLTILFGDETGRGVDWLGSLRYFGVVAVEALALYPMILLNLRAALANVDPMLERAAHNLGASRWRVFWRVTFPLVRPGLFAGCTLVLIWSFTELGAPLMFHVYEVTPVQVFLKIGEIDNPLPYALVLVMLACSSVLYVVGKLAFGRSNFGTATKAASLRTRRSLPGLRGVLAAVPFAAVLSLALLPNLSVLLTSVSATGAWYRSLVPRALTLQHYLAALEDELVMPSLSGSVLQLGAVGNSIFYAGAATLIGVGVALGVALVVVRSDVPFRGVLDVLSMIPLAVPGLVMAFGYLALSVQFKRVLGAATPAWLDAQRFPVVLLILAYAARRLPYVVRSAAAGLQQVPRDYERAAANLGGSSARVLLRIVLPLIAASVLAGALMAFVFAVLEVSDSLVLAQSARFFPITRAIWELSQRLGDGLYVASALGVWAMALLTSTLLLAGALLGKRLGAMFRA
ncbi:MAG TPA: iron ABC transporter permease [Polyangiaceae bacterium]|nr:iron ABC transporter permease [Polyangiaceae bacterium]